MSPSVDIDLLAPEAVQDPHPLHDRLRSEDPVHWYARFQSWYLTCFEDIVAVLRDHHRFSSRRARWLMTCQLSAEARAEIEPLLAGMELAFVFLDPPKHRVIRRHVADAFTPRHVETLRARVTRVVHDLLEDVAGRGRMDVVSDLACVVPARVIAELFGVPQEDSRFFQRWTRAMNRLMGLSADPPRDVLHAIGSELTAMGIYFIGLIQRRRREPSDDLLGRIVESQRNDAEFTDAELLATCVMIIFGGDEMVQNTIANAVMLLLTHPEQMKRLGARPELVPSALEECLRYEPPAATWGRIATEDVEIRGRRIRAGDHVVVSYASANRDPGVFQDPHRFDIERAPNPHISFSAGIHHCIGASLARMNGQIVLSALLTRMPRLGLATDVIPWGAESLGIRSLRALPVTF